MGNFGNFGNFQNFGNFENFENFGKVKNSGNFWIFQHFPHFLSFKNVQLFEITIFEICKKTLIFCLIHVDKVTMSIFFILATYGLQNVNLNMKYTETMFKKIGEKIINLDFC